MGWDLGGGGGGVASEMHMTFSKTIIMLKFVHRDGSKNMLLYPGHAAMFAVLESFWRNDFTSVYTQTWERGAGWNHNH